MPFPPRSSSRRLQKNVRVKGGSRQEIEKTNATTIDHHEIYDPIEPVNEHRHSMAGRPQSAGIEKRRLKRQSSTRRADPLAAKEAAKLLREQPTCGKDLERNGQTITYETGLDTFNFPTPSPRMPPRSATFDQRELPPSPGKLARSKTYRDSPFLQPHDDSPQIGVAIGSPSQGPPTWRRSYTSDAITTRATAGLAPSSTPPVQPEEQVDELFSESKNKKKSNWKGFSNFFRSKTATEPFYRVKTQATTVVATVAYDALSSHPRVTQVEAPERPPTPLSCLLAPSANMPKLRDSPGLSLGRASRQDQQADTGLRTSIMPKGLGLRMRGTPTPPPHPKSPGFWRRSEDAFGQRQSRLNSPRSRNDGINDKSRPAERTPRLDLDLPVIDFPRYSIMFEKQLLNGSRPSLLERRQSRIQRSYSQGGDGDHLQVDTNSTGIRRSKTSPSFRRKLSIRTKEEQEPSETPATAIRRPGPMPRSKTEPITAEALRSIHQDTRQSSSPDSPGSAFYSENSLPPTPTTAATCTDTDSVRQMLDNTDPASDIPFTQLPPIPPPTNRFKSYSFSTSTDDEILHTPLLPLVKAPHDIIQVSVARQVSVSRARTRVMQAMEGTARPAVVPLKPRLVEFSSQNRKSAFGVLEDLDADMEDMPKDAAAHSRVASLAFAAEAERRKSAIGSLRGVEVVVEGEMPGGPVPGR